jgi:hypothetical protein
MQEGGTPLPGSGWKCSAPEFALPLSPAPWKVPLQKKDFPWTTNGPKDFPCAPHGAVTALARVRVAS